MPRSFAVEQTHPTKSIQTSVPVPVYARLVRLAAEAETTVNKVVAQMVRYALATQDAEHSGLVVDDSDPPVTRPA